MSLLAALLAAAAVFALMGPPSEGRRRLSRVTRMPGSSWVGPHSGPVLRQVRTEAEHSPPKSATFRRAPSFRIAPVRRTTSFQAGTRFESLGSGRGPDARARARPAAAL